MLLAQGPAASATAGMEYPKIDGTTGDQVGQPVVRFFSAPQMAALRRLSDLLVPHGDTPGALDAKVPEFLDFWIGKSPLEQQKVYTAGLDALNKASAAKYKKPFAELDDAAAAAVIDPGIKVPWNYTPPADALAHLLQEAKRDIRMATTNSREYSAIAAGNGGGRRQGGMGLYWYPLD